MAIYCACTRDLSQGMKCLVCMGLIQDCLSVLPDLGFWTLFLLLPPPPPFPIEEYFSRAT